jgi:DNA polymerase III delta prime subunit
MSVAINATDLVQKIKHKKIKHDRIGQLMQDVFTYAQLGSDTIQLIVGPPGAGKSTLAKTLHAEILRQHEQQMDKEPALIPVLRIEARSCGEINFDWKLFYTTLLESLESADLPVLDYTINPVNNQLIRSHGLGRNTKAGLRRAVEKALKARGVKFLLIDEAGHLTNVCARHIKLQMDTLKSLANNSGCQIVLFGSYDVHQIVSLSGQLARRIKVLHFERYREEVPEDERSFFGCLKSYELTAEGQFDGVLIKYARELHQNCLGCIGLLSPVVQTLALLVQNKGKATKELLMSCMLSVSARNTILSEILEGENDVKPSLYGHITKPVKNQKKVAA